MYQSSATFTVLTGGASTADSGNGTYNFYYDTTTAGQLARTFPYILSSSLLTDAIKEDLGVEAVNGSISAQAISESNMITMSVISQSPEDAKAILESAIKVYPDIARFVIGDTRFNIIDELQCRMSRTTNRATGHRSKRADSTVREQEFF